MKEYKTTGGYFEWRSQETLNSHELFADDPSSPKGKDWKLVGSAASDNTILWFWEREATEDNDY